MSVSAYVPSSGLCATLRKLQNFNVAFIEFLQVQRVVGVDIKTKYDLSDALIGFLDKCDTAPGAMERAIERIPGPIISIALPAKSPIDGPLSPDLAQFEYGLALRKSAQRLNHKYLQYLFAQADAQIKTEGLPDWLTALISTRRVPPSTVEYLAELLPEPRFTFTYGDEIFIHAPKDDAFNSLWILKGGL